MTLIFREPETFKTPDGGEYVILPVQVDDMPILFSITNKRNKLKEKAIAEAKKKNKIKKGFDEEKVEVSGEDFIQECGSDIQNLITKTVLHTKTGEPLPLKYRQMTNMLDLMGKIMDITTIETPTSKDGDGNPLEQNLKSSGKSSEAKPT